MMAITAGRWMAARWLLALLSHGGAPPRTREQPHATNGDDHAAAGGEPLTDGVDIAALYQQHAPAVLAFLCTRLPSLHDAEDLLAEVFVAALRSAQFPRGGGAIGLPWLLVVARRRVADYYRAPRAVQSLQATFAEDVAMDTRVEGSPEAFALRAEELRELRSLLASLPDDQCEVLALRFAAGLRSSQIAGVVGKSDEAVRAMLSRAIRRLRKEWAR